MSRRNRGIGVIGPDYEPPARREFAMGLGEVLWWVIELALDLVR
jgi:hypothetical protein